MLKDKFTIRVAEPADALTIIDFNRRMARETENKDLPLEIITNGVNAVFADVQKGFYVVAETIENKEIVGSLLITFEWSDWRNAWFWWIQSVYVRADFRGRGVYRTLYEWVEIKSQAEKVCGIRLYVERENSVAQKVYQRLGMNETVYQMYEAIFEK